MAKRKLNVDINKSVTEFESAARKARLDLDKAENVLRSRAKKEKIIDSDSSKKRDIYYKKNRNTWRILGIFWGLVLILVLALYIFSRLQGPVEVISKESISDNIKKISAFSVLGDPSFRSTNLSGIPEKNIENIIIIQNEDCLPQIECKYLKSVQRYGLSTLTNENLSLDRNIMECYDHANCISNFSYLALPDGEVSKQKIKIEKEGENKLRVYDTDGVLIAEIERRYLKNFLELYVGLNFD